MSSESSIRELIQEHVTHYGRSLRTRIEQPSHIILLKRDFEIFEEDLLRRSDVPMNHRRVKVYLDIIKSMLTEQIVNLLLEKLETIRDIRIDSDINRMIYNALNKNVNPEYTELYNDIQVSLGHYRTTLNRYSIARSSELENNAYRFLFDVIICKHIQSIRQVSRYRDLLVNYLTSTTLQNINNVIFDHHSIEDEDDPEVEEHIQMATQAYQRIVQALRPERIRRTSNDFQTQSAFSLTPITSVQPSKFQNMKSKSKPRISSSDIRPENISTSCSELVGEFKSPFKGLGNKLKKICAAYTKKCESLDTIKQALSNYTIEYQLNYTTRITINQVNPNYTTATLFNVWKNMDKQKQKNVGLLSISATNFDIKYANSVAYGEGVVRDFFQRIINELTSQKIFITRSDMDEPILRYFLNPDFQPDDTFKQIAGLSFDKESDYGMFYKFIGGFIRMIICNNIGLHFDLSHVTLAHMLYKPEEITDDDYIAYAMLDFPRDFKRNIANLMKDPNSINDMGFTFNSQFPILKDSEDKDLQKSNFKEYALLRSKYLLTQKRFDKFISGFGSMRRLLSHLDVTIPQLQSLITFAKLNEEILTKLIENIKSNNNDSPLRNNLISILRKKGSGSTSITDEKQFYEFVENLLHFWTGYRHYVPYDAYKVISNEGSEVIKSQTCFKTLYIPESIGLDKKLLYNALVLVVQGGLEASAFQILGGKKAIKKKTKKISK